MICCIVGGIIACSVSGAVLRLREYKAGMFIIAAGVVSLTLWHFVTDNHNSVDRGGHPNHHRR